MAADPRIAELRARFNEPFNQPSSEADYGFWIKAAYWTPEEAIALTLGKQPEALNDERVLAYLDKHERFDSAGLLQRYHELRQLVQRGIEAGELDEQWIAPEAYMLWARRRHIPLPAELDAVLEEGDASVGAQESGAKARVTELEEALAERDQQIEQLRRADNVRVRASLQKLVLGMAVTKFQFTPRERNSAASNISDRLAQIGIQIDADTVRKHLQEAADEIEFEDPRD